MLFWMYNSVKNHIRLYEHIATNVTCVKRPFIKRRKRQVRRCTIATKMDWKMNVKIDDDDVSSDSADTDRLFQVLGPDAANARSPRTALVVVTNSQPKSTYCSRLCRRHSFRWLRSNIVVAAAAGVGLHQVTAGAERDKICAVNDEWDRPTWPRWILAARRIVS